MLVADQMIQMLENDDRSKPRVSLADQKDVAYVLVWYENNFLLSPSPALPHLPAGSFPDWNLFEKILLTETVSKSHFIW